MCQECKKEIIVNCIKSVDYEGKEIYTKGKSYGAFSWYHEPEDCYYLSLMINKIDDEEFTIASATEDNAKKFEKDEYFKEHFELIGDFRQQLL